MNAVRELQQKSHQHPRILVRVRGRIWKPVLVAATIALAIGIWTNLPSFTSDTGGPPAVSAFSLLSHAYAAERTVFSGDQIVHVVSEIVVKGVSDPQLARMQWLPVVSLEATGKPRFHQLTLPAEPGRRYTVDDHAWHDPATGRFAHLMTVEGKPIFANSYDGNAVYSLSSSSDGSSPGITRSPVTQDFRPPGSPAAFLGIASGSSERLNELDESLVVDAGDATLEDGSEVHVLKVSLRTDVSDGSGSYWLFKIRGDDSTIAEMEWMTSGESGLVLRRVRTGTAESAEVPWDLTGLEDPTPRLDDQPQAGVTPDFVLVNVSVQHMVERAGFETYIFAADPPWAGPRRIADILDVTSPPRRMFCVTYRADDGRHVVFFQCHGDSKLLGPEAEMDTLVYASPTGSKVWSGPRNKGLAGIILQSASSMLNDRPSEQRTGYLIETPTGTFTALAINGHLTEDELHPLIDSLGPAREQLDP